MKYKTFFPVDGHQLKVVLMEKRKMVKELLKNLSGRIGEIYIAQNLDGTHRVVQDKPESADCCLDWRVLDDGLNKEEAERLKNNYLSGEKLVPPFVW